MNTYSYKTDILLLASPHDHTALQQYLNEHGQQGWKLSHHVAMPIQHHHPNLLTPGPHSQPQTLLAILLILEQTHTTPPNCQDKATIALS